MNTKMVAIRPEHNVDPVTQSEIANWFTHHPPAGTQTDRYQAIRRAGQLLAEVIVCNTPRCDDQAAAIRKVREAVMTANAAIACSEQTEDQQHREPVDVLADQVQP